MKCWNCSEAIDIGDRVEFRARCPRCDRPMHVCLNCEHYDPGLYNQCRETMAERVIDKQAANFCEYYRPRRVSGSRAEGAKSDARARLDALFGKKPR